MKLAKSCKNCIYGISIAVNDDILCRGKGVVSPDYLCSKHKYSPVINIQRESARKCISCENFIINCESAQGSTIGLCRLFSVRQFDGTQKNTCSKYIEKTRSEVS